MQDARDERPGRRRQPLLGQRVGSAEEPLLQENTTQPIIDNPDRPPMGDADASRPPVPAGGEQRLMPHEPPPPRAEQAGVMAPVPSDTTVKVPAGGYTRQQPRQGSTVGEPGGYLRLELRVAGGVVSLVGASRVDGPLSPPEPLIGGVAYEATLAGRQVGAGAVPDPGVQRVIPHGQSDAVHRVVEVDAYQLTVRVPLDRISSASLADLQVAVYRLDGTQPIQPTPQQPLHEQAGRLATEVATLRGIRTEQLPEDLRASLDRALR